jgi:periplasmic protein TonB
MAVQILNDMPDAAVYRGEPASDFVRAAPRTGPRISGRSLFMAATIGLHVLAIAAFMSMRYDVREKSEPEPIVATMLETPPLNENETLPASPPLESVVYALPAPPDLSFEVETTAPEVITAAITNSAPQSVAPPMIESVEYVRAPAPVYPHESSRKRERGTVVLRVLVDATGRPAQIQIERSSGYSRLDVAARDAVEKALFRPYEVNGIAQPAQVLVPIEFTRRAS